ncbi:MAG: holo-ACP synthase [Syntrophomonadaceae bacterium]|nr:holo-ACP synthase [Syntrophomonadaceae bacterium]NLX01068.1 holo-ACP synthase [Syntrophomonadaceae bacterium]
MLIGVDIIEIERVKKAVERTPRFLDRVFTSRELGYCMKKANPYPSLAARFAAKEALRKLHPAFITGVRFHDLEVLPGEDGRPQVYLHGEAEHRCRIEGIGEISISLSHSRVQAIATAIAKKG